MRIPLFFRLFLERLKSPRYGITASFLIIYQIVNYLAKGVFESWLFDIILKQFGIGVAQQSGGIMGNFLSYWPILILIIILAWIAYQTKRNYWSDFSVQMVKALEGMHKRMMEIEKEMEQHSVTEVQIHNVVRLIADELGIVKIDKWPEFIEQFKNRLNITSDTLPTSKEDIDRIASQIVHFERLIEVKGTNYSFDDAKKLAGYMDGEHIGVGEIRNSDGIWNKHYDKLLTLQRSYNDKRLNVIIERYTDVSYVVASFALWKKYAGKWEDDAYLHYYYVKFIGLTIDFEIKYKFRVNELIKAVTWRISKIRYFGKSKNKRKSIKKKKR